VKKIYSGPTASNDARIYADGGFLPGSELGLDYLHQFSGFDVDFLRYMVFVPDPGPTWQVNDLNFERDYKRVAMMEAVYAGTNPDLRKFKAAGGKLILYHGWADTNIPPLMSVDYYETAEKTMGGSKATQEFFRLFMIPGMDHCGGGEGASEIDYVSYLENWVERGEAPEKMIGTHVDEGQFFKTQENGPDLWAKWEEFRTDPHNIKFTRPVYPYPMRAKYTGHGDPNDAVNFRAVEP
jgi:feruloyl esterase